MFKKFPSDYWGERGFPILIIGGRVPGLPPRVYAYAIVYAYDIALRKSFNIYQQRFQKIV